MKKSMLLLVASFWVVSNVFAINVAFDFKSIQATSGTTGSLSWSTGKTGNASNTACNATNGLVLYGVSGGGGYFNTTSPTSSSITQIVVVSTAKKNTPKYTIYGSSDGSTWTSIESGITAGTKTITLSGNYTYIKIANTTNATAQLAITSITITFGSTETTPSITQQPKDATYDQGATPAALTITASGNPTPTYRWYSNTSKDNSNGTAISGATEASYTPSTATAGTFYYYCVATNSKGSATSDVATIKVNAAQTYTVLWSLGGDEYAEGNPTTSVKSGERVTTLPTPPDGNAIGSCANTFMGWSTHDLGKKKGQSAPTDLFTTIEDSPVITQNTIFYAVFATKQNGN